MIQHFGIVILIAMVVNYLQRNTRMSYAKVTKNLSSHLKRKGRIRRLILRRQSGPLKATTVLRHVLVKTKIALGHNRPNTRCQE